MALTREHIRNLAYKHHGEITGEEYHNALSYIRHLETGILKEIEKVENEYERDIKNSHGNKKYIEMAERRFVNWRHILISVLEPLADAKHHWKWNGQNLTKQPVHEKPRWEGTY
ncbi:hypothetical protein OIC52_004886 [Salmonella enterica]|nr:hypothetical protein [Salmonella enterica]